MTDIHPTTKLTPPTEPARAALWNPNAAANWSVLFTPAFGAYLQMLNWRALGKPKEAAASQNWFYASLGFMVLILLLSFALPETKTFDGVNRAVGIGFLFAWYFTSARSQVKYVRENFGQDYPRKPWPRVLAYGVGFVLAYLALAFVLAMVLSLAGLLPE